MSFAETLNAYMNLLSCSAREVAQASGLSEAAISRYRAGQRIPAAESPALRSLAAGLAAIARARGRTDITPRGVRALLGESLETKPQTIAPELLALRLNTLFSAFELRGTDVAHALSFDASYLSRIRNGQRRPADAQAFALKIGHFFARHCRSEIDRARLYEFINAECPAVRDDDACARDVAAYLASPAPVSTGGGFIDDFLQQLDQFAPENYIQDPSLGPLPPLGPAPKGAVSREIDDLQGLMEAQLDFLRLTVASSSDAPVVMYCDLPLMEMASDLEFAARWMAGMVELLRRGLHLHMVHDVERPFTEMLVGLKLYIPLYMTGQLSPHYLRGVQPNVFNHHLWTSGGAALTGCCIEGDLRLGRFRLTNDPDALTSVHRTAAHLLDRAEPLMDIFREDRAREFERFLDDGAELPGARYAMLSALPVYTLSPDLTERILRRSRIAEPERERIRCYIDETRARIERTLTHSTIQESLPLLTREEFRQHPMHLSLSGLFCAEEIPYTWDEYREHLALCDAFAAAHDNYRCIWDREPMFRNIQIAIHRDEWVLVAKGHAPAIQFLIRHPQMRKAIENMLLPFPEE